jgi:hypothetical protein
MEMRKTLSLVFGTIVLVLAAYVVSPPSVRNYVSKVAVVLSPKSKQ